MNDRDPAHEATLAWLEEVSSAATPERLRTHSYVVVETVARREGFETVP